jgi:hypothetical protein
LSATVLVELDIVTMMLTPLFLLSGIELAQCAVPVCLERIGHELSMHHEMPRVLVAAHHGGNLSNPNLGAIVTDGKHTGNLAAGNDTGITTNTGFREAVRSALKEYPKGLKPAEVIDVLKQRGDFAKYNGRVKFSDRVYSELYALKQSEQVTKRYGRYVIVITTAEDKHA